MEPILDDLRKQLIHLAFAESTHSNRQSHLKSYLKFCNAQHYVAFPIQALVASRYVAFLAYYGRTYGTIQNHIASLKHFHQLHGFTMGWDTNYLFALTLKGLKRYSSNPVNRKQAITPQMLHEMSACLNLTSPLHAAMWSLFLVAFFSFLRKSNLVISNASNSTKVLCLSDLQFTAHGASLDIRETKTIQFKQRKLSIPIPSISGSRLCPISALRNHLLLNQPALNQPLFSVLSASGSSYPITYTLFSSFLKQLISIIGYDPSGFSPHSFRRGGATFAFDCGLPAEVIKMQGDWRSDAYQVYLELTDAQKQRASEQMAHKIHML